MQRPLFFLLLAILFEVSGTTSMKLSNGFSKLLPSLLIFVFYGLSFASLTLALKGIDISRAYALWSGVGTAIVACIGIFWFQEEVTLLKTVSILLIITGVVGINLGTAAR